MTTEPATSTETRRPKRQWAPYLLVLPSLIYLAIFFAWPMVRAIRLAVWDETALLTLRAEILFREQRGGRLAARHVGRPARPPGQYRPA